MRQVRQRIPVILDVSLVERRIADLFAMQLLRRLGSSIVMIAAVCPLKKIRPYGAPCTSGRGAIALFVMLKSRTPL